jgi:hypothetical protein
VRGSELPHAKLTPAFVVEIRASDESDAELARRFGVTPKAVAKVRDRKSWKHVA